MHDNETVPARARVRAARHYRWPYLQPATKLVTVIPTISTFMATPPTVFAHLIYSWEYGNKTA